MLNKKITDLPTVNELDSTDKLLVGTSSDTYNVTVATLKSAIQNGAIQENLGAANAGKVLAVGNDGNVTLVYADEVGTNVRNLTVTHNGTYTAAKGEAYSPINVNVQNTYTANDENKVVRYRQLVSQTSRSVTSNGSYDTTTNNSVSVNVQPNLQSKTATSNGEITADSGYDGLSKVEVDVPNTYTTNDEGKVVRYFQLVPQTSINISRNGTYDTTNNNVVNVNVSTGDDVIPLSVSKNGTYNAPIGAAYNPVTVEVFDAAQIIERKPSIINYDEVSTIASYAFYCNNNISKVAFENCETINGSAFYQCYSLSSISFPNCVNIGSSAFYYCNKLELVEFPYCTTINRGAFANCTKIENLIFNECLTIGEYAFSNCKALKNMSFPKCSAIYSNAFTGCVSFSSVIMPECLEIGSSAFQSCSNLISVSFTKCNTIYSNAFRYCASLKDIYFPSCEIIHQQAFVGCSELSSVSFSNCSQIYSSAFYQCYSLSNVYFPVCEVVGQTAFMYCSSIRQVDMPLCATIGGNAFAYCNGLGSVSFPMCTNIGRGAFNFCHNLGQAYFPNCTTIFESAFWGCDNLSIVSLPKCIIIGYKAFSGCNNLVELRIDSSSVPRLESTDAFASTPIGGYSVSAGRYGSIFVPLSMVSQYIVAPNWSRFSSRITAIS